MGKSTVSETIRTVCNSIWQVFKEDMLQPTKENWETVAKGFYDVWNMPNCIGAIDGKHVVVQVGVLYLVLLN